MALPVLKKVFTGEVIKKMSSLENGSFLDGIKDMSQYVSSVGDEAQAIHLTAFGVEPDVLINNTTYPIPLQDLEGEDVVVVLDKFQTKTTPITDDELYAATWDKMTNVKNSHGSAIQKNKFIKALHALAPTSNSTKLPVLRTTGENDGTGRLRLTYEDLVRFKTAIDENDDSEDGRRLVLCNDHVNDLLLLDEKFKDQFFNTTTGKVYNLLGFDLYTYKGSPVYSAAGSLKSLGAVSATGDRKASVYFNLERAVKAKGWTKMYYSPSETDTDYQRNKVNFRHNFIVLPTLEEGRGAIISANA